MARLASCQEKLYRKYVLSTGASFIKSLYQFYQLHGPSMLPDKAKFVECSIISLAPTLWIKHLVIGQLQKTAKFSAFHWSPS